VDIEPVHVSVVIPARNEQDYLPRLLDTVDAALGRYHGGRRQTEVIVADNASTDSTPDIARSRGCRVVEVPERRIATVRNRGAAAACGSLLAFIDADMRIHPETFNAIDRAMTSGKFVAGATGVKMERWSPGIALTYALMVPWVILLRMDTGVVFCSRSDFERIGGYDERRYFGEDVQLLWDLKRVGKERGQRLTRLRPVKALTSLRKWDQHGDWHYFRLIGRLLPIMLSTPSASNDLVQPYSYGDERAPRD
jgi:glycosyltransferase involved in cell wall biosynthesis